MGGALRRPRNGFKNAGKSGSGGRMWTRTTDLVFIRDALLPTELYALAPIAAHLVLKLLCNLRNFICRKSAFLQNYEIILEASNISNSFFTGKVFIFFLKIVFNPIFLKSFSHSFSDLKEVWFGFLKILSKEIP